MSRRAWLSTSVLLIISAGVWYVALDLLGVF